MAKLQKANTLGGKKDGEKKVKVNIHLESKYTWRKKRWGKKGKGKHPPSLYYVVCSRKPRSRALP
jgi:hypothetical protein